MKRKIVAMLAVAALAVSVTPVTQAKAEEPATENAVEESTMTTEIAEHGASEIVESGTCGDNVAYTLTSDGTLTISGNGNIDKRFGVRDDIKKVVIESGVTNIGSCAFFACKNIESISMPESITNIGDSAFSTCVNLRSISIPESVTSIGRAVFYGCDSLTSIAIPKGVTSIEGSTFAYCEKLESVSIPKGVTNIANNAFLMCESLTDIVVSPENTHYASVDGALYNKNLTELMRYPADEAEPVILSSVTTIGDTAFSGDKALTKVKIPQGVTKIGEEAFSYCTNLSTVEISNSVKTIDINAFLGCTALKSVVVPSSVTSIGGCAFDVGGEGVPTEDFILYCYPGSVAETYAKENGVKYTLLDIDELRFYDSNGNMITNEFVFDGTYTYFMQADGSPMRDTLTYHPDGEHIIYLDSNGHEVFTNFQYCPSVGYTCYFDSNGYIYKDQITFVGDKTYYLNTNGKLENEGWFQFGNGMDYGYANWDGTLNTCGFSYDPWGRVVFYHWNGMVARGLITDGQWYYLMDETDGHYVGSFPVN